MKTAFIILGLLIYSTFLLAIGFECGETSDWLAPSSSNGWGVRWFKYLWCGMVKGHVWKEDIHHPGVMRCTHCGKTAISSSFDKKTKE